MIQLSIVRKSIRELKDPGIQVQVCTERMYKWQEQLLNELRSSLGRTFRQRKVLWVQDLVGGAGKSTFIKYMSLSNSEFKMKKLPLDKPDRLRMMVYKILQNEDVTVFVFDFTRTLGEETSVTNLFQIIEEVKNGHIVSAMYGNPMEGIFNNPYVIVFTNQDISIYCQYLSMDRWIDGRYTKLEIKNCLRLRKLRIMLRMI